MKHILAAFFISSLFVQTTHGASFYDVSDGEQEFNAIHFLQSIGVVHGYPDGSFQKNTLVTRAEFVKMFIETSGLDKETLENCVQTHQKPNEETIFFPDVPADAWFAGYVCAAKTQGIVNGYPDGYFRPYWHVSYPEAAKIIIKEAEGFGFATDNADVWYKPYLRKLAEIHATPSASRSAQDKVTRGDVAEMLFKAYTRIASGVRPHTRLHFLQSSQEISFYFSDDFDGSPPEIIDREGFIGIASKLEREEEESIYCPRAEDCFERNGQTYVITQKLVIEKKSSQETAEQAIERLINGKGGDFSKCQIDSMDRYYRKPGFRFFSIDAKEEFTPTDEEMRKELMPETKSIPGESEEEAEMRKMFLFPKPWEVQWAVNKKIEEMCTEYSRGYGFVYDANNADVLLAIELREVDGNFVIIQSIRF